MAELEAVEAARRAVDDTIDAIEQRKGIVFNGMFDPEVNEIAEAAVRAAAPLIVAATRRQVAEELRAEAGRLDIADDPFALDIALAAHWLTDRNAAIARGRGETS